MTRIEMIMNKLGIIPYTKIELNELSIIEQEEHCEECQNYE